MPEVLYQFQLSDTLLTVQERLNSFQTIFGYGHVKFDLENACIYLEDGDEK